MHSELLFYVIAAYVLCFSFLIVLTGTSMVPWLKQRRLLKEKLLKSQRKRV